MKANHDSNGTSQVPVEIVRALRTVIRRARIAILLRGAAASVASALAAFLLLMALDATVVIFSQTARVALSCAAYAVAAAAAWWFLARPLARSFTLEGVARILETRHPELQERISSTVEILTSDDHPAVKGSEALIRALTEQAVRDATVIRPRSEAPLAPAVPMLATAAIILALFASMLAVNPQKTAFLLVRVAAPMINLPNVHAVNIEVSPGNAVVAEQSPVEITARVKDRRVSKAALRMTLAGGSERSEMMTPALSTNPSERVFVFSVPAARQSFRYRVLAADALTRFYDLRVVPPPALRGVDMNFAYPAYTGLPPKTEQNAEGSISEIAGTEVSITARLNKHVASALLTVQTQSSSLCVTGTPARLADGTPAYSFRFALQPYINGSWSLRFTDEFGLSNSKYEKTIRTIPDAPPVVTVRHLEQREMRLNPEEILPLFYSANDDFAVAKMELCADIDGRQRTLELPAEPESNSQARVAGSFMMTMSQPPFAKASRITFQIRATDNLPPDLKGPQSGASPAYTIILDPSAPTFDEQALNAEEQALRDGIQKALQATEAARNAGQTAAARLPAEEQPGQETARKIEEARTRASEAGGILERAAESAQAGFFEKTAEDLRRISEGPLQQAARAADMIALLDRPEDRAEKAREMVRDLGEAAAQLDRALKDIEKTSPEVRRAVELSRLAAREQQLAAAKLEMEKAQEAAAEEPPMTPDEWKIAQERIAERLAKLMQADPSIAAAAAPVLTQQAETFASLLMDAAEKQHDVADQTSRIAALQKADAAAQQLAREQALLAAQSKTNISAGGGEAFELMKKAAEAISAHRFEDAVPLQEAAASVLTNEAATLRSPPPPAEQLRTAAAVKDLAERQSQLASEAANTAEQRVAALKNLAAEQTKLAEQARSMQQIPQADAMARAAEALLNDQPRQALAHQSAVEKALSEAAQKLRNPPPTPEKQEQARVAKDLAERQDALKQKVDDLVGQRKNALQQMAAEQEALAAEIRPLPAAMPAGKLMARATDAIKTDQPRQALALQEQAVKAAKEAAEKAAKDGGNQEAARKLEDIAKRQENLSERIKELTRNRAEALQKLAEEQARLAADAMARRETASAYEPMSKAADSIRGDQPKSALQKQEQAAKALRDAAESALKPSPTPQQLADAKAVDELRRRQESLRDRTQAMVDQQQEPILNLAARQEALAAEARRNPAAAPAADQMKSASDKLKIEQLRQAVPAQQEAAKKLASLAEEATRPAPPSEQQKQAAAIADNIARLQAELRNKTAAAAEQEKQAVRAIAAEQEKLAAEAQASKPTAEHAQALKQAAEAIKAGDLQKALEIQEGNEKALRETASQILHPSAGPEDRRRAEQARNLAKEEEDIRRATAAAAESFREGLQRLADAQKQLAVSAMNEPDAASQADAMKKAARAIESGEPRKALATQDSAARNLAAAAEKASAAAKNNPRQRQKADRLKALSENQAALERDADKFIADQAVRMAELARRQEGLAAKTAADPGLARAADQMKQAAEALHRERPDASVPIQQGAVRALESAASSAESPSPTPEQIQQAQKAIELARRQDALRGRLADIANRDAGLLATVAEDHRKDALDAQSRAATEIAELAADAAAAVPGSASIAKEAAAAAAEAQRQLAEGRLPEAARAAARAAVEAGRLGKALKSAAESNFDKSTGQSPARAPTDAALDSMDDAAPVLGLAERAKDLAARQAQIARELAAGSAGMPLRLLSEEQRGLSEHLGGIKDELETMRRNLEKIPANNQAAQTAGHAFNMAAQAAQASEQASKLLAGAAARNSQDADQQALPPDLEAGVLQAQQTAARALDEAAQAMADIRKFLNPESQRGDLRDLSSYMAQAHSEAAEAARMQTSQDAIEAAAAVAKAASEAIARAAALGANPRPDFQQRSAGGGGANPLMEVEQSTPQWAFEPTMKLRNWLRLPGRLQDNVLQASGEEGPEEYRDLIKSYFREISRERDEP